MSAGHGFRDERPWGGSFALVTSDELASPEVRGLTRGALLTFLNIAAECRGRPGWNLASADLMARTGLSRAQHQRAVRELVGAGLLDRRARFSPEGRRWPNGYALKVPSSVIHRGLMREADEGLMRETGPIPDKTQTSPPTVPPKGGSGSMSNSADWARLASAREAAMSDGLADWIRDELRPVLDRAHAVSAECADADTTFRTWVDAGHPEGVNLVSMAQNALNQRGHKPRRRTVVRLLAGVLAREDAA